MTRRLHLKQVEAVNRGFAPSEEERRWAARVLAACSEHPEGAFAVDGKLVDKPIVDRARRVSEVEASENRSLVMRAANQVNRFSVEETRPQPIKWCSTRNVLWYPTELVARASYLLSKNTSLYSSVGYMINGRNGNTSVAAGGTVERGGEQLGVMLGVRHSF